MKSSHLLPWPRAGRSPLLFRSSRALAACAGALLAACASAPETSFALDPSVHPAVAPEVQGEPAQDCPPQDAYGRRDPRFRRRAVQPAYVEQRIVAMIVGRWDNR